MIFKKLIIVLDDLGCEKQNNKMDKFTMGYITMCKHLILVKHININ